MFLFMQRARYMEHACVMCVCASLSTHNLLFELAKKMNKKQNIGITTGPAHK